MVLHFYREFSLFALLSGPFRTMLENNRLFGLSI